MQEIKIDEARDNNYDKKASGKGLKKHIPKWVWATTLIVLLFAGIGLAVWIYKTDIFGGLTKVTKQSPSPSQNPNDTPCPLDGVMTTKERAERRPLGIMIENSPEARPQSGLDKASFIFETPSEGGITRFLALYVENDADEIGPVRSARTYYVEWADEVQAIYAHAGGSAIALENLKKDKYLCDINHDQDHFWRDNTRYAPHNLYTTTDKIRSAAKDKKCTLKADYDGYEFKEDAKKEDRGTTKTITVDYSSSIFKVVYNYDPEKNVYLRNLAGEPHTDKITGEQLSPKTVIVMHALRVTSSWDGTQQSHAVTTGSGKAEIYMDGQKIEGTWKRTKVEDRTEFFDSLNKEIVFNRGQIWVNVIPPTGSTSSSQ